MSELPWIVTKILGPLLSFWRHFNRRISLKRLSIDPIPDLSHVPDASDKENERFVFAFRLFNENVGPLVIRGIQPRLQLAEGGLSYPVVMVKHSNGDPIDFPLVLQPYSKVDFACGFRIPDNTALHVQFNILILTSTPNKEGEIKIDVFRDPKEKQVYANWQGRECFFGEFHLEPGKKSFKVRFRKQLSRPPKIITTAVVKKSDAPIDSKEPTG
jgi:hypothetical protein